MFLKLYVELQHHDNNQRILGFEIFSFLMLANLLAFLHFNRNQPQQLILKLNIRYASFYHLLTRIYGIQDIFNTSLQQVPFINQADFLQYDLFFEI
jgi:hypothetical protein